MHATLLHWCSVNFLLAPMKVWFFAVALPRTIRGKLLRLEYPKRALGAFPFSTQMPDSAVNYLAAWHPHLPVARFLLRRQGPAAGAPGGPPTPPPRRAPLAEVVAAAPRAVGAPPPPPSAPGLDELLHLGDAARGGGGGGGDARSALRTAVARVAGRRGRACGATLALVALSLVLFLPARVQGFVVEELLLGLGCVVLVVALEAASTARRCAAAGGAVVHAHGAAVAAPLAAVAAIAAAGLVVRARRAHRRAEKPRVVGAVDTERHRRGSGAWHGPAAPDPARASDADAALFPGV